VPPLDFHSMR